MNRIYTSGRKQFFTGVLPATKAEAGVVVKKMPPSLILLQLGRYKRVMVRYIYVYTNRRRNKMTPNNVNDM